jgi:hypothetical protein
MCTRIKQVTNLSILVGASALLGCASVPTTDEYAISHGYQPTQVKGRQYFCRLEQPAVPGEPHTLLVKEPCFTRVQIIQIRYAGSPPVPDFNLGRPNLNGGPYDPSYNYDNPYNKYPYPPTGGR